MSGHGNTANMTDEEFDKVLSHSPTLKHTLDILEAMNKSIALLATAHQKQLEDRKKRLDIATKIFCEQDPRLIEHKSILRMIEEVIELNGRRRKQFDRQWERFLDAFTKSMQKGFDEITGHPLKDTKELKGYRDDQTEVMEEMLRCQTKYGRAVFDLFKKMSPSLKETARQMAEMIDGRHPGSLGDLSKYDWS